MAELKLDLKDEAATLKLGRLLAPLLQREAMKLNRAFCVFLKGDLGAGKTTLSRAVITSLGHQGPVRSPTFTLVESYQPHDFCVYHFDLYRLNDAEELEYMGIRDYFASQALCLVEWPERASGVMGKADATVEITYRENSRHAVIKCDAFTPDDLLSLLS